MMSAVPATGAVRGAPSPPTSRLCVLSLGAGIQSTTLALMAAQGEIDPMPDCAIFAVGEPPSPPPYPARAYTPLTLVAASYQAAGAKVMNLERCSIKVASHPAVPKQFLHSCDAQVLPARFVTP
jgi:hypothetical protein